MLTKTFRFLLLLKISKYNNRLWFHSYIKILRKLPFKTKFALLLMRACIYF